MLLRLIPPHFLLIGALVAVGAAGIQGYRMGVKVTEARVQAETKRIQDRLNEAGRTIAEQAAQIAHAMAEKRGLIDALENAARSDPGAANRVPSDISLQRLRRRWGADGE